jgi:VWFA-related protein
VAPVKPAVPREWPGISGGQEVVLRADVHLVEVSIVATDAKGARAEGLAAADFRVWDDGKEQTIASFQKLDSQTNLAPTGLPPNTYSNRIGNQGQPQVLSMILLDAIHTNWGLQNLARWAMETVLGQIEPGERVAIYALGRDLRVIHDFSSDRQSLLNEIKAYHVDPKLFMRLEAEWYDLSGDAVRDSLATLKALADHVKGVPGRKNLIWLSRAFPPITAAQFLSVPMNEAITALNNANVSLYPVDPGGVFGNLSPEAITMKDMAAATGGKAYYVSKALDRIVRLALDDTRETYLLTYSPKTIAHDGAYHAIRVETARRGVELRYRRGYNAPGREGPAGAEVTDRLASVVSAPLDVSSIGIRATVNQAPGGNDVSAVLHIDPADLELTPIGAKWTGALRLEAVQTSATGERLGGVTQSAAINLQPATYRRALAQGLDFHMKFKRQPAAVAVRIGVVDERGGNAGSLSVPLPPRR